MSCKVLTGDIAYTGCISVLAHNKNRIVYAYARTYDYVSSTHTITHTSTYSYVLSMHTIWQITLRRLPYLL